MNAFTFPEYPALPRLTWAGLWSRQRRGVYVLGALVGLTLVLATLIPGPLKVLSVLPFGMGILPGFMVFLQEREWQYQQTWPTYAAQLATKGFTLPQSSLHAKKFNPPKRVWRAYLAITSPALFFREMMNEVLMPAMGGATVVAGLGAIATVLFMIVTGHA